MNNPRPIMVHFWSRRLVPERSEALASVVDEVVLEFAGKLDAVRSPGTADLTDGRPSIHLQLRHPSIDSLDCSCDRGLKGTCSAHWLSKQPRRRCNSTEGWLFQLWHSSRCALYPMHSAITLQTLDAWKR